MDVAFEKQNWTIAYAEAAAADADGAHPEWFALRARLRAARQAWHALRQAGGQGQMRRCGSFDRGAARQLAALKTRLGGVNQKDSVNRNRGQDTYEAVADLSSAGGRG